MMLVSPRVWIPQGGQVLEFPEQRRNLGEGVEPEVLPSVPFKQTFGPGDTHTLANLASVYTISTGLARNPAIQILRELRRWALEAPFQTADLRCSRIRKSLGLFAEAAYPGYTVYTKQAAYLWWKPRV